MAKSERLEVTARSSDESEWDSVEITTDMGEAPARRLAALVLEVPIPHILLSHEIFKANGKPRKPRLFKYLFRTKMSSGPVLPDNDE